MQELIEAFYHIREVPYRIPLSLEEEDWCCSWKSKQLFEACSLLWVACRYRVCEFFWSDMPLPDDVDAIFHEDLSTHVFLEIQRGNEWYCVDPTRDSWLWSVLSISERDGSSSTYFAVKPIKFYDLVISHEIMHGATTSQEMLDDLLIHKPFYQAVNDRLWSLRNHAH